MANKIIKKFEAVLNRGMALDPDTLVALSGLDGKTLSLEFVNTKFTLYIFPDAKGFRLEDYYEGEVDVCIRGTPVNMISYLVSAGGGGEGFTGRMEITGDIGLAQQFQSIMKNIDLDWEEHLSHVLGDTFAHKVGNIFRRSLRFAADTRRTLELDISEYLRYEKEVLPEQTEVNEFISAIDEMRDDAERLKLRVDKLEKVIQDRN